MLRGWWRPPARMVPPLGVARLAAGGPHVALGALQSSLKPRQHPINLVDLIIQSINFFFLFFVINTAHFSDLKLHLFELRLQI